jgi:hypothetical protein
MLSSAVDTIYVSLLPDSSNLIVEESERREAKDILSKVILK